MDRVFRSAKENKYRDSFNTGCTVLYILYTLYIITSIMYNVYNI